LVAVARVQEVREAVLAEAVALVALLTIQPLI
jgi:hypothetical protein